MRPIAHALLHLSLVFSASEAFAQASYEVAHTFVHGPRYPERGVLLQGTTGALYGTTFYGGTHDYGTVFAAARGAGGSLTITPIHSFTGGDGIWPTAGLIEVNGYLYGTTSRGGAYGYGTVFRLSFAGSLTTLHSFDGVAGALPLDLIRGRDGNLYGMTEARLGPDGTQYIGTIFRISTAGAFTMLHQFSPGGMDLDGGGQPLGPLVQAADGTFYGTTTTGGSWSEADFPSGIVFKFTEAGEFTRLHTFAGSTGPAYPFPRLIATSDGSIYGTASWRRVGGADAPGSAFRMSPDGDLVFINTFADAQSGAQLMFENSDGTFIGSSRSSVFRMTTSGTVLPIRSFTNFEGARLTGVVKAADGRLYGAATEGGWTGRGAVFGVTMEGQLASLNPFIVDDEPNLPVGPLLAGEDGALYGVSCRGGWLNAGAIYKLTPEGTRTTLHSFTLVDGLCPFALTRGTDGTFFGVALFGGPSNVGTLFSMTPAGTFRLLHTFTGPNGRYPTELSLASDGRVYGSTLYGGLFDGGTLFRATGAGAFASIHSFPRGCRPHAPVEAADGNLYGTTYGCGPSNHGSLYRLTTAGGVTTLRAFDGTTGVWPSPLLAGSDGRLYGTFEGSEGGPGVVFASDLAGTITTLHTFVPSEGQRPAWGLTEGTDGALYGVTFGAAPLGGFEDPRLGTVFRVTTSGTLTLLHTFDLPTGARPFGPVVEGADGGIYGTTVSGGTGQHGVLFRISLTP